MCADNSRIQQALAHLLDTAIRVTNHGHVALVATDIVVQVQIIITGSGRVVPQESLRQLFIGMISADHTLCRESDGLGIGGAIAAGIIAAYGGTIPGESVPGEGARIVVGLPASAAGVDCR